MIEPRRLIWEHGKLTIEEYRLTNDTKRAMRAFAQWELGDRGWADMFLEIAETDDPVIWVNNHIAASDVSNENDTVEGFGL